ncbi:methyltransferase domain-containing protein, partial [Streptomyces albireticuli]
MTDPTLDAARPYMIALADELKTSGALRSPRWARAFTDVPRHLFVPEWYEQETDQRGFAVWRHRRIDNATDDLAAAYRDITLVTALDPATAKQVDDHAWTGVATSSSTLPRLMAGMLETLAPDDEHLVLEIGTGTGYNAALLSARLGDSRVYSVDVDPGLVETARTRLAAAGYTPHLAVGDGREGYPGSATSFDRIIATCSVTHLPAAWIERTRPGGAILTDLALGIEGGLVHVTVDNGRRATGGFTATAGRFMAARADARAYSTPDRSPRAPEAD